MLGLKRVEPREDWNMFIRINLAKKEESDTVDKEGEKVFGIMI